MPSSKKKATKSRMNTNGVNMPQLSNEMQLELMNKVKRGELSIDDALQQARKDREQLLKESNSSNEEQTVSQYNFSVHKNGRYRWQKRILQLDFKTKMLCSIEKGIIKRQLPFLAVKSCDDGVGSRFSISFKGNDDYELEAKSLEDKHKMMHLVNQIIYGNIYNDSEEDDAEKHQQPQASQSQREGVLLLLRGGLASFKWVKYEVQLHPGQLILVPFRQRGPTEVTASEPMSIVIHLSDGDTSVQKSHNSDTFTLTTHKNVYQFKVPVPDETAAPGVEQGERDAWVQAIQRLCLDWKRKSRCEHMFMETFQHTSITEDTEDNDTDPESNGRSDDANNIYPPAEYKNADPVSSGDTSQSHPTKPVTKPRIKSAAQFTGPDNSNPIPTSPCSTLPTLPSSPPPSPCHAGIAPSSTEPGTPVREGLPPPSIPAPPPLPLKPKTSLKKKRTKAFHWDVIGSDKIARSFWKLEISRKIEIDTSRLYEQFAIKDLGMLGVTEPNNTQHIMMNQKIAHNFNIFLKSFPVQPGELKDKLFIINEEDGGLSDEHITSLRRYVPTMDDAEMYKSLKGPVTELHIVDQYMMEMCNIPYLSTQLDLLLTLRELPISMNDLQPLINQKIRMCTQLYNCRSFVSVLEYLLTVGNYLNENAGKEKAKGFRLSSLTKLSQLRGRNKKFTLLHALVEQIMLHEPHLATFTKELAEFETVAGASIKGLTAEVDVLKNEVQKAIQYRKTCKKTKAGAHHPTFSEDLKMVIEKYNLDLTSLTKMCEEMKKLYSAILVKFGEPADQDSQEFFGVICQFLHDFKRAYAETV
ncbi:formin-like protein 13 isoform X2 [Melanotaenia boesemani]|uniref:formin-like protein 13 isoform X2 n=1 Tax=Melanotaenia boesemani TaxID=1250792 RepID=UPI001C03F0DF|nr:formin-like protein 13 isoform X2 [Melanotaenia boesemani]